MNQTNTMNLKYRNNQETSVAVRTRFHQPVNSCNV